MSEVAVGTILLFSSLAVLMVIRIPIAFSLAISALVTATYLGIPYFNLFQKMSVSLLSFTFIAVPFFIMMATYLMNKYVRHKDLVADTVKVAFKDAVAGRTGKTVEPGKLEEYLEKRK